MLLGETITRGAPQVLWECSALVLGSEPGELALTWPHELVTVSTFLPDAVQSDILVREGGLSGQEQMGVYGRLAVCMVNNDL